MTTLVLPAAAAHKGQACVKALVLKGSVLLLDHSADIRACASSLGVSL